MVPWVLMRALRPSSGARIVFSTGGVWYPYIQQLDLHMRKNELDTCLRLCPKVNSKWVINSLHLCIFIFLRLSFWKDFSHPQTRKKKKKKKILKKNQTKTTFYPPRIGLFLAGEHFKYLIAVVCFDSWGSLGAEFCNSLWVIFESLGQGFSKCELPKDWNMQICCLCIFLQIWPFSRSREGPAMGVLVR